MSKINHYLSMLFVAAGILLGVQLPNAMHQYAQRVDAHYLEAERAAAPYHLLANQLFNGSMQALIEKHQQSGEVLFQQEAEPIKQLIARETYLRQLREGLSGNIWQQTWYALRHPDQEIAEETVNHYQATIPLTQPALIAALAGGILAALLYELLLVLCLKPLGRMFIPRSAKPHLPQ